MGGRRAGAREVKKEKSDRERERERAVWTERKILVGGGGAKREAGRTARQKARVAAVASLCFS